MFRTSQPTQKPRYSIPDFAKAAYALNANQISEPTKSRFGYHVRSCAKRGYPSSAGRWNNVARSCTTK